MSNSSQSPFPSNSLPPLPFSSFPCSFPSPLLSLTFLLLPSLPLLFPPLPSSVAIVVPALRDRPSLSSSLPRDPSAGLPGPSPRY